MRGDLIPQGAFDLDPEAFIEKYLSNDFEYRGIVVRKGKKGGEHHAVLVKYDLIKSLVTEYYDKDPTYCPKPGDILTYTKFFETEEVEQKSCASQI